jgi:hypothetical protein
MAKMGFCLFTDGGAYTTDVVAPKSDYASKEDFFKKAKAECDGFEWEDIIKLENVTEAYCRWYPVAPEGCDIKGGCYSFSKPGLGAFPVWRIDLQR